MRWRRFSLVIGFAAVVLVGAVADRAFADGASTLMRWSYGKPEDEGSDTDKPLETDRPDFTESPKTVGKGVFQVEGGYTFTYNDDHNVRTADHSFPETLYR